MSVKIVIIDYGMGNLRSVQNKLERLKIDVNVSSNLDEIDAADKLILPGVGHFETGMNNLRNLNLIELLNKKVLIDKTPILGICLGMQLLSHHSEEGNTKGLAFIDAHVVRFKVSNKLKYKIPHIGWNMLDKQKNSEILKGIEPNAIFYFIHSFHVICNQNHDILTTTIYELPFVSSFQNKNIYGTQFHPEKSHEAGEMLVSNFCLLV